MIDGESYLGRVLVRPLSQSGDVTLFLWPLRCLKSKMGGPPFGIDVKGEEIIRFDPHRPRGHWHKGGYDKLWARGSHTEFPDGVVEIDAQISWALDQIWDNGQQLLYEAGYADASVDPEMVGEVTNDILSHLDSEGDLRSIAVERGLIDA